MPKIKQLSQLEAQKIAAGEVVERPANVVKELVENSLDAGATQITIHIEDAGKKLIRIIDNGCGMNAQDAQLCFAHHATSKITTVDDLATIATFGFRGEALSSICAVSKVTLITKDEESTQATKLILEGGITTTQELCASTTGTDIAIEDLFYNVPARKKFLKTRDTEWRQIVHLFHALCLDYPLIHFRLLHDGHLVHNCPPTEMLTTRIAQLWDHNFAQNMVTLQAKTIDTITIAGSISNHHYYRYDRNSIFLFVNKRWVKNFKLSNALLKGYNNALPAARYPAAFIFIELPADQVDINIHPRKEEVQFLNPRKVELLVQETVKATLEQKLSSSLRENPRTEIPRAPITAATKLPDPFIFNDPFDNAPAPSNFPLAKPVATDTMQFAPHKKISWDNQEKQQSLQVAPKVQTEEPHYVDEPIIAPENDEPYNLIGQLDKTYLLLEQEQGLFIVDQHAAHERILYEQFSKRFTDTATVNLLFPTIITLNKNDLALLEPHLQIFHDNGIMVERFGEQQLVVNATPVHLKNAPLVELIKEVISWIAEHQELDAQSFFKTIHEKLRAQMACKAAVKAGDQLTTEQMLQLLKDLHSCNNRFTCPHGRPTGWLMSSYEIEKKFKRKV